MDLWQVRIDTGRREGQKVFTLPAEPDELRPLGRAAAVIPEDCSPVLHSGQGSLSSCYQALGCLERDVPEVIRMRGADLTEFLRLVIVLQGCDDLAACC